MKSELQDIILADMKESKSFEQFEKFVSFLWNFANKHGLGIQYSVVVFAKRTDFKARPIWSVLFWFKRLQERKPVQVV